MPSRKSPTNPAEQYRFGFNGKEKDNEMKGDGNSLDFGARIYDSRIGRFTSRDPLAKSYPFYSPYQFAGNTPIMAIDLDGREVLIKIGDVPNGTTKLRVIGNSEINGAPKVMEVNTYPMTVTDPSSGVTSTYSVTRDALYINSTELPDQDGNVTIKNIPFEPNGGSTCFDGEERETFGKTELPAVRLRKNGSTSLKAKPVDSPFRGKDKNVAKDINIHVGGTYTTPTTPEGFVNRTGSEGCFTVVGGNESILQFKNDIDSRQENLKQQGLPSNVEVEITPRTNVVETISVPSENN